ncbi:uncharacterized protein [Montipora foliosa]|uniref:uncharacterized protein n=1 Tax=Montipora foliosa TaxID=591990 RepID=UPI0035F1355D
MAFQLYVFSAMCIISSTANLLQTCEETPSVRERYLKGHVISSGSAADIGECLISCSNQPWCKSINFRFDSLLCEVNDADRYTDPLDYVPASKWQAYSDFPTKPLLK